jgi:hypothetical protein
MVASEKLFDVKVRSSDVFVLNAFKPGKKKDSATLHADLVLVLDREEKDAALGRDLLFLEDRARQVLAGTAPTMKVDVASNEEGKLEVHDVRAGVKAGHLCSPVAVIRKAQLVVTSKSVRLLLHVRLTLDDVTCSLALHTKSDLHLTWHPQQLELKLAGTPPGQDGAQVDEDGDVLPPEPEDDKPKRGRRVKAGEA